MAAIPSGFEQSIPFLYSFTSRLLSEGSVVVNNQRYTPEIGIPIVQTILDTLSHRDSLLKGIYSEIQWNDEPQRVLSTVQNGINHYFSLLTQEESQEILQATQEISSRPTRDRLIEMQAAYQAFLKTQDLNGDTSKYLPDFRTQLRAAQSYWLKVYRLKQQLQIAIEKNSRLDIDLSKLEVQQALDYFSETVIRESGYQLIHDHAINTEKLLLRLSQENPYLHILNTTETLQIASDYAKELEADTSFHQDFGHQLEHEALTANFDNVYSIYKKYLSQTNLSQYQIQELALRAAVTYNSLNHQNPHLSAQQVFLLAGQQINPKFADLVQQHLTNDFAQIQTAFKNKQINLQQYEQLTKEWQTARGVEEYQLETFKKSAELSPFYVETITNNNRSLPSTHLLLDINRKLIADKKAPISLEALSLALALNADSEEVKTFLPDSLYQKIRLSRLSDNLASIRDLQARDTGIKDVFTATQRTINVSSDIKKQILHYYSSGKLPLIEDFKLWQTSYASAFTLATGPSVNLYTFAERTKLGSGVFKAAESIGSWMIKKGATWEASSIALKSSAGKGLTYVGTKLLAAVGVNAVPIPGLSQALSVWMLTDLAMNTVVTAVPIIGRPLSKFWNFSKGAVLGAAVGGVIGTLIAPGVGTAVGAMVGGFVGGAIHHWKKTAQIAVFSGLAGAALVGSFIPNLFWGGIGLTAGSVFGPLGSLTGGYLGWNFGPQASSLWYGGKAALGNLFQGLSNWASNTLGSFANIATSYAAAPVIALGTVAAGSVITQNILTSAFTLPPFEQVDQMYRNLDELRDMGGTPGCWPTGGVISGGINIDTVADLSGEHANAIDIVDNAGAYVYPTHSGTVTVAGWLDGYGNVVYVEGETDNKKKYTTVYAHLQNNSIEVHVGQQVDPSTQLGVVDSTGNSSEPHLHYEIKGPLKIVDLLEANNCVDPLEATRLRKGCHGRLDCNIEINNSNTQESNP